MNRFGPYVLLIGGSTCLFINIHRSKVWQVWFVVPPVFFDLEGCWVGSWIDGKPTVLTWSFSWDLVQAVMKQSVLCGCALGSSLTSGTWFQMASPPKKNSCKVMRGLVAHLPPIFWPLRSRDFGLKMLRPRCTFGGSTLHMGWKIGSWYTDSFGWRFVGHAKFYWAALLENTILQVCLATGHALPSLNSLSYCGG